MLSVIFLIIGLLLLVVGGEMLVKGATRLALSLGLSPLVIGLTVVAFGTSSPELVVSMKAALVGNDSIALSNVIGSNTFNLLVILGICALIRPLVVKSELLKFDLPIMIMVSIGLALPGRDLVISKGEGLTLSLLLVIYTTTLLWKSKKVELKEEQSGELYPLWSSLSYVVIGLLCLVGGSHWSVEGAVGLANWFGISERVIGLTLIASGTSLPELVTSIVATRRGQLEVGIGNVIGSNIFNILGILGLAAFFSAEGLKASLILAKIDFSVMLASSLVAGVFLFTGKRMSKFEGLLFLLGYLIYLIGIF